MRINHSPIIIQATTTITCYREIFIHKRRSSVIFIWYNPSLHFQFNRKRIARANNFFSRMSIRISSIHPIASMIIFTSFFNSFCNIKSFTALIPCTPEKNTRIVSVTQHHLSHTFTVHFCIFFLFRDKLCSMRFCPGFIYNKQAIFICKFQITAYRRIV